MSHNKEPYKDYQAYQAEIDAMIQAKVEEEERKLKRMSAAMMPEPPSNLNPSSYTDVMRKKIMEDMDKVKKESKIEERYTRITDPVNVFIMPTVQCAECMQTYEITLEPDGIRLRFRHLSKVGCSRQMTQFHRPVALFMKEI